MIFINAVTYTDVVFAAVIVDEGPAFNGYVPKTPVTAGTLIVIVI